MDYLLYGAAATIASIIAEVMGIVSLLTGTWHTDVMMVMMLFAIYYRVRYNEKR